MTINFKDGKNVQIPVASSVAPYSADPSMTSLLDSANNVVVIVPTSNVEYISLP